MKEPSVSLLERLQNMTPEQRADWQRRVDVAIKETAVETERRHSSPPESPRGTCVACGSAVKGEYRHELAPGFNRNNVPVGSKSGQYYSWRFKGYHCEGCGLCYRFPPPDRIITRLGDDNETITVAPHDPGGGRNRP